MSDIILLPVSIGEALDKLSILDIKLDMIKDSRRDNVKIEFDLLYNKLKLFIIEYECLYAEMKEINHQIWLNMDILRDGEISNDDYLKVCKQTIIDNDIRFRIKNKMNTLANSNIKEQKGYKITKYYLDIKNEDIRVHEYCVHFCSLRYDEVYISSNYQNELKQKFSYDSTIQFIDKNEFNNLYIDNGFNLELLIQKLNIIHS